MLYKRLYLSEGKNGCANKWEMCMIHVYICMSCCSKQVDFEVRASAHVHLSLQVWCIYHIRSIEYTSREAPFGEALDASTYVTVLQLCLLDNLHDLAQHRV